jgi:hypothetical protein
MRIFTTLLLFALAARAQDDIESLKSMLAAQQQQIDELRKLVQAQQRLIEQALPSSGVPRASEDRTASAAGTAARTDTVVPAPAVSDWAPVRGPLSLNIGGLQVTPTGFFDFSQVWRFKTLTSGLPTNFAAVPFVNTVYGQRHQTLSSGANSRIGMQVDTKALGVDVSAVVEADFLGYEPGNLETSTNSYGLRLRLAYADFRKGKWDILGGQAWSLSTPSRKGISPLPSMLFLTQDVDPNIQSGLVWARTPQFRAVYHATERIALGVSLESGDTYGGGSSGAGAVVLPAALAPNYFGQIDTGSGGAGVPNPNANLVAKIAFDPAAAGRSVHVEIAGMANRFAFFNPLNGRRFSVIGGGVALNAGVEVARNLTLFTNNYYSNGGGSRIFGEGPNLIVRGDGAPSLVPAGSTVNGVEYQPDRHWELFAYYGGTYIQRRTAIDPSTGQLVGYGYSGSPNNQNRSIQEVTGGIEHRFWNSPNYGFLQFTAQYSWIVRHPWYVAPGQPASANLNMIYLGLRYGLPGAPARK